MAYPFEQNKNTRPLVNPRETLGAGVLSTPDFAFAFKDDPDEIETKDVSEQLDEAFEEFKGLVEEKEESLEDDIEEKAEELDRKLHEKAKEIEDLKETVEEVEKKAGRPGASEAGESKTPGEHFTDSEEYEEFCGQKGEGSTKAVEFGGMSDFDVKALTSDSGSAGAVVRSDVREEIIAPAQRETRMRDLLQVTRTSSNSVEYIEETNFYKLETPLASDAAGGDGSVDVENARGLYAGLSVEVGTETLEIDSITYNDDSADVVSFVGTLSSGKSAGDDFLRADTFEATPEAEIVPTADMDFNRRTAQVVDIAYDIPVTRNMIEDAPRIEDHINTRGITGLQIVEEDQILYGDGTSEQLQGIMTHGDVPEYNWSSGETGDTKYDAIRRAMTLAIKAHYPVTGMAIHPDDLEDIETAKGSDGHYIRVAMNSGSSRQIWRVPYVETPALKSGEAVVGAMSLAVELSDRQQATVRVSDSHKDYFTRRMMSLLIEERVAQAINRPEALVKVNFDSAP